MKKNKSFTIVEITVAMSIFVLVIGGSIVLVQQTLSMVTLAEQRLAAFYLAQEGVELVRNIRDNNWLRQQIDFSYYWDTGFPHDSPAYAQSYEIDYSDSGLSSMSGSPRYLCLDSDSGYSYDNCAGCSGSSPSSNCTKFTRVIKISRDRLDSSPYGRNDPIIIESHVNWNSKGKNHEAVLQIKLYNWYGSEI